MSVPASSPTLAMPAVDSPQNAASDPAADDFRTVEYNRSWGLEAIGAADAYAQGPTGEGVTVGFVDFNFEFSSSEAAYAPASLGPEPDPIRIVEAQTGEPVSTDRHGHAVSVIAAGVKNDLDTHGVAFDAEVLGVDFFSGVNTRQVVDSGVTHNISDPWSYLIDNGARIVNKSIGFDEGDLVARPPGVAETFTVDTDARVVELGGLLVVSAGNNSDPEPSLSVLNTIDVIESGGLLAGDGALIVVGAVDRTNRIAPFSDRAGPARDFFLVAPGVDLVFPWNGALVIGSGTSFSAPHVTGAAAVLLGQWPQLKAREVADILFATATDLGAPGVDDVFGHGLLDLDAALRPVGTTSLATPSGSGADVTTTAAVLGPAFGDAPAFVAGLHDVMILDEFTRDFRADLAPLVTSRTNRAHIEDILRARHEWRSTTLAVGENAELSFAVRREETSRLALGTRGLVGGEGEGVDALTVTLAGTAGEARWVVGSGRRLGDSLGMMGAFSRHRSAAAATSGAFAPAIDTGAGGFAVGRLAAADGIVLSIGLSAAERPGVDEHPVPALGSDQPVYASALRIDRLGRKSRVAIEAGAAHEAGSLLGARTAGGFGSALEAQTAWLTLDGEGSLGETVSVMASVTAAVTHAEPGADALVTGLGTIASTSFSFGIFKKEVLGTRDVLSLTLHQPLHVERAPVTLVTGEGLDATTGGVLFGRRDLSLAPSGREIAVEAAYGAELMGWTGTANLAYRFDRDHVAGETELALLLALSRGF